jgi:hypothetical protein
MKSPHEDRLWRSRIFRMLWPALVLCLTMAGCIPVRPAPADLGTIYGRSAEQGSLERNPVIVIPGFLGSRLVDSESAAVVWGTFSKSSADPRRPEGARLIALPMARGTPLAELRDALVPQGLVERVRVKMGPLPVEQTAYAEILTALGVGGYRDPAERSGPGEDLEYPAGHYMRFQFDYDWRRDNVETARALAAFIEEKRAKIQQVRRAAGLPEVDVKFDLVAHSMGGLAVRYFLRYGDAELPADGSLPELTWAGARHVERAVLVAPPNAGSVLALAALVHGDKPAASLPHYAPAILGTMPALYQLLPRARHRTVLDAATGESLDVLDPELWQRHGWGLASPAAAEVLATLLPDEPDPEARRQIALEHLHKSLERARRLQAALDVPATPPEGLTLALFAGDARQTEAVVTAGVNGALEVTEKRPGDGTVLRSSALMDERVGARWQPQLVSPVGWSQVTFLFRSHTSLTKDPMFIDNLLYLLLEAPS